MLKVVSDSIDKLKFGNQPTKKVLHPGSHKLVKTSSTSPMSPSPPSSNLQQTKKEILDTELELITKQSSGEDTSALRLRLMELTQQVRKYKMLALVVESSTQPLVSILNPVFFGLSFFKHLLIFLFFILILEVSKRQIT